MAAGLVGALAPDLDSIAALWNPMNAITMHRTVTHSFVGGLPLALLSAGLIRCFSKERFFTAFLVFYLGILSHIGLDILTPFGTAIFWPLTDHRFSLAQHHVIDPLFTALVVGFLVLSFKMRDQSSRLAKIVFAFIGIYLLVTTAVKRMADVRWHQLLEAKSIVPIRSVVVPLLPGPLRWLGVVETEDALYQMRFWIWGAASAPLEKFTKTENDVGSVEKPEEARVFLKFARFPWRQESQVGAFRVVEYRDLAFVDHPFGGPMSLRVWLDESNNVQRIEFGHVF